MMKLLRIAVLLSVTPLLAFGQRGGGHGGGGSRGGGGGARVGGGSGMRSGGSVGGGFRGGSVGGGFRGGSVGGGFRGGSVGGGFRGGSVAFRSSAGFHGNTFVRVGFGNRFYGGYGFYGGLSFGYGYPYYYPYSYYPYSYDPYYYGAPYYDNGYYDNGYYGGTVGYVQQAPPAGPTVITQNIGGAPVGTVAGTSGSFYRAADYYLIAFNDHTIRAALSYTVNGDEIRYTTREHEERAAPLSSVDVRFSEQINRDRRVEFRLP